MSNERYVIGIDLGTTNSAVAKLNEYGKPETIVNTLGDRITPSVISLKNGLEEVVVGAEAKRNWGFDPELTIVFIKRQMRNNDAFNNPWFPGRKDPSFYSGVILKHLVKEALPVDSLEDYTIEDVDAVITVPANYGFVERERVMSAAKRCGLNVLSFLNEPTAAAIAYGLNAKDPQTVLVYDLGGGTFDVTILKADPSKDDFEVLHSAGEDKCGGRDWDYAIACLIMDKYNEKYGTDYVLPLDEEDMLSGDYDPEIKSLYARIMLYAEIVKKNLTDSAKKGKPELRKVSVKWSWNEKELEFELTNKEFDTLTKPLLEKTLNKVDEVLENFKTQHPELDVTSLKWILVGGSSRMPQVTEALVERYGCKPIVSRDADEIVAKGAAIIASKIAAAKKEGGEEELQKVLPKDILTKTYGTGCKLKGTDIDVIQNVVFKGDTLPCSGNTTLFTRGETRGVYQFIYESEASRDDYVEDNGEKNPGCILLDEGTRVSDKTLRFSRSLPKDSQIKVTYHVDVSGVLTMTATAPDGSQLVDELTAAADYSRIEMAERGIIDNMETSNS